MYDDRSAGGCANHSDLSTEHFSAAGTVLSSSVSYQSRTAFDSFIPMEVACSKQEIDMLVQSSGATAAMAIAEDRSNPIKMKRALPYKWCALSTQHDEKSTTKQRSASELSSFNGTAQPGEWYSFQVRKC
jgi:hypothetical protein